MKTELNNIVVEVLDLEHGQKLKNTFKELGCFVNGYGFCNAKSTYKNDRYYGIINNIFYCYTIEDVNKAKAKIITLDELKAMKQPKEDVYPKLMYVGENRAILKLENRKRTVFLETSKGYWAYDDIDEDSATLWKYAQDIQPEAPIEKEVIDINIPNLENVIVTINGKEVGYK